MFERFFSPPGILPVKGPNIKSAPTIVMNINGINISFLAPKHGGADPIHKQLPFSSQCQLADIQTPNPTTADGWPRYQEMGYRYWGFKGPYLSGKLATMTFSVTIVKIKPESEGFSLFNKGVFERVLQAGLIECYGHQITMGHPEYVGPINWKIHNQPLPTVSFDAMTNPLTALGRQQFKSSECDIVLSDDCYLCIAAVYSFGGDVDASAMKALCEGIFDSIKIELSPQQYAEEQLAFFKQSAEALSEKLPPIKWVTREQEAYAKACALYDKAVSLMDLFDYGSPEGDELDKFIDSIPIKSQCNGWDDETFDYSLPPNCPTELPSYLLAAMEKHGIHTEQDYKDFLIDHRYRRANSLPLLRPLSAARHLVEKSSMAAQAD